MDDRVGLCLLHEKQRDVHASHRRADEEHPKRVPERGCICGDDREGVDGDVRGHCGARTVLDALEGDLRELGSRIAG